MSPKPNQEPEVCLNYSKFVSKLNLDNARNNLEEAVPCNCGKYDPIYHSPHHNQVLTGDLSIIKNDQLGGLFYKGPKFREQSILIWLGRL